MMQPISGEIASMGAGVVGLAVSEALVAEGPLSSPLTHGRAG